MLIPGAGALRRSKAQQTREGEVFIGRNMNEKKAVAHFTVFEGAVGPRVSIFTYTPAIACPHNASTNA